MWNFIGIDNKTSAHTYRMVDLWMVFVILECLLMLFLQLLSLLLAGVLQLLSVPVLLVHLIFLELLTPLFVNISQIVCCLHQYII